MKFIFLLTGKVSALEPELGLARNKTTSNQSKNMNKMYKAAILAALGLASVTAAQAVNYNGDLLVGFTTGSGNDVIYDLGAASSLTSGETWDLSSPLTGYALDSVQWGVIGSTGPSAGGNNSTYNSQRYVYTTDLSQPQILTGKTMWQGINGTYIPSIYQNFSGTGAGDSISIASSDANSWYGQTTFAGQSGPSTFITYANPNTTGTGSVDFYQMVATGSSTVLGTFSLDSTDTLTFSLAPVPEPTTTGLMAAGGGLLMLAGRNKFGRKQS